MPSMFSFDFAIALSRFLSKFFALSVLATSRRINPGSVQTTTGSNSKLGQLCSCASNACKKKTDKQLQIYVTWWLLLRDVIWIHMGDVQLSRFQTVKMIWKREHVEIHQMGSESRGLHDQQRLSNILSGSLHLVWFELYVIVSLVRTDRTAIPVGL